MGEKIGNIWKAIVRWCADNLDYIFVLLAGFGVGASVFGGQARSNSSALRRVRSDIAELSRTLDRVRRHNERLIEYNRQLISANSGAGDDIERLKQYNRELESNNRVIAGNLERAKSDIERLKKSNRVLAGDIARLGEIRKELARLVSDTKAE